MTAFLSVPFTLQQNGTIKLSLEGGVLATMTVAAKNHVRLVYNEHWQLVCSPFKTGVHSYVDVFTADLHECHAVPCFEMSCPSVSGSGTVMSEGNDQSRLLP